MPSSDDRLTLAMQGAGANADVARMHRTLTWLTAVAAVAASLVAVLLGLWDSGPSKGAGLVAGLVFSCTLFSVVALGSALSTWAVRRLQHQGAAKLCASLGVQPEALLELTVPYGSDREGKRGQARPGRRKTVIYAVIGLLGVAAAVVAGGTVLLMVLVALGLLPTVGMLEYYRRYAPPGAGTGPWTV